MHFSAVKSLRCDAWLEARYRRQECRLLRRAAIAFSAMPSRARNSPANVTSGVSRALCFVTSDVIHFSWRTGREKVSERGFALVKASFSTKRHGLTNAMTSAGGLRRGQEGGQAVLLYMARRSSYTRDWRSGTRQGNFIPVSLDETTDLGQEP